MHYNSKTGRFLIILISVMLCMGELSCVKFSSLQTRLNKAEKNDCASIMYDIRKAETLDDEVIALILKGEGPCLSRDRGEILRIAAEKNRPAVIRSFSSPDAQIRSAVIIALANTNDPVPENFTLMLKALADKDPSVIITAFDAISHLAHAAAHNMPPAETAELRNMYSRIAAALKPFLESDDIKMKSGALSVLGSLPHTVNAVYQDIFIPMISNPAIDAELLIPLLDNNAAIALAEDIAGKKPGLHMKRSAMFLGRSIAHARLYDRTKAAGLPQSLVKHKTVFIKAFQTLLTQTDADVQTAALSSAGEMGPDGAPLKPELLRFLSSEKAELKIAAAEALVKVALNDLPMDQIITILAEIKNPDISRPIAEGLARPASREKARRELEQRFISPQPDRSVSGFMGLLVLADAVISGNFKTISSGGKISSDNPDDQLFYEKILRGIMQNPPSREKVILLLKLFSTIKTDQSFYRKNIYDWMLEYKGPPVPGMLPMLFDQFKNSSTDTFNLFRRLPDPGEEDIPLLLSLLKNQSGSIQLSGSREFFNVREAALVKLSFFKEKSRPYLPQITAALGGWNIHRLKYARQPLRNIGLNSVQALSLCEKIKDGAAPKHIYPVLLAGFDPAADVQSAAEIKKTLYACAQSGNQETAYMAAETLLFINRDAHCAFAAELYRGWLKNQYWPAVYFLYAAEGLGNCGSCASPALPALRLVAKEHINESVRSKTQEAIRKIENQSLNK